jgi:hypothetical protein
MLRNTIQKYKTTPAFKEGVINAQANSVANSTENIC